MYLFITYIYIYIYIYDGRRWGRGHVRVPGSMIFAKPKSVSLAYLGGAGSRRRNSRICCRKRLRRILKLRFWISEGFTQAESTDYNTKTVSLLASLHSSFSLKYGQLSKVHLEKWAQPLGHLNFQRAC